MKGDRLLQKGIRHRQFLFPKRTKVLQAVAIPVVTSPTDSADYRKKLAESYGFKQIGEPLPEDVKLKDVIDTLPKKVMLLQDAFCVLFLLYVSAELSFWELDFGPRWEMSVPKIGALKWVKLFHLVNFLS